MPSSSIPVRPLAVLLAVAPEALLAQAVTGTLGGWIVDGNGAPLGGATVTITQTRTVTKRTAVSRRTGLFVLPLVPAGDYEIAATLAGFDEAEVCCVKVGVDADVRVKLELHRPGAATVPRLSLEVLETPRPERSTRLDAEEIAVLPAKDFNLLDLVLATPGVAPDPRPGEVSFGGQRGTHNSLLIDGVDAYDGYSGRPFGRTGPGRATLVGESSVEELRVDRAFSSIERNLSGFALINVVTRSGTNQPHGSTLGLFEDSALDAGDGKRRSGSFGASLGGPVLRDRLFLFASYDGLRSTDERPPVLTTSGLPADPDTASGRAALEALATPYDSGADQDLLFAKADYEWGPASHFSARLLRQRFAGIDDEHGRDLPQSSGHASRALVNTDMLAVSYTTALSSRLFEELRLQDVRSTERVLPRSDAPEAVITDGGFAFAIGRSGWSPSEVRIRRLQATQSMTYLAGAHALKGGFDFIRDLVTSNVPGNFTGSYAFASVAAYQRNQPAQYVQAFSRFGARAPDTHPDLMRVGLFLQDEWRTRRFTVSLGWRYNWLGVEQPSTQNPDPQLLAAAINTKDIPQDTDKLFHGRDPDENDYSVRLGLAYNPWDRTLLRAGWGFYRGDPPATVYATGMAYNGIDVKTLTFTSGTSAPKPSITFFDWDFADPVYVQWMLGAEQRIAPELSLALTYHGVNGASLGRLADANLGTPSTVLYTDGLGNVYPVRRYGDDRRFTNFDRVLLFENNAVSRYHGVTLELDKRFSHGWQARLAYTYGKVIDTKPDATAILQLADDARMASDPRDFNADRSVGDTDQRHRLVLSGTWRPLDGWTLSGIVTVASGQPYSATLPYGPASDLNNDGNGRNDRAPGTVRNQFRLPTHVSLDPRLSKDFAWGAATIELTLQAFNVLNRSNVTAVNTAYYSVAGSTLTRLPTFGTPTATAGPRRFQLGARVVF